MDEPRVGRELDAAVAERVFKMHDFAESIYGELIALPEGRTRPPSGKTTQHQLIPHHSTNIADAWQVVDKLNDLGWLVTVKQIPEGEPFWMTNDPVAEPNARLMRRAICELYWVYRANKDRPKAAHPHPCSYGDTAPEATCRAALMVVDNEGKEVS